MKHSGLQRTAKSAMSPTVVRNYSKRAGECKGKHHYSNTKSVSLTGTKGYCNIGLNINCKTEIQHWI